MPQSLRQPHFAILLGLAWLVTAAWLFAQYWPTTGDTFSDPDDAMRLVQVRTFLAGQGWFDLSQMRIDPPLGYVTHWSRLIDAGLAGLFLVANTVLPAVSAERVMLAVWPLLWLLPAMAAATAIAWRLGGREAALIALILAVFGLPAFQHFKPGHIDHHNVQIALALAVIAAAVWSDRIQAMAIVAGAVSALALAIGFESLPWVVLAGAAIAARYALDPDAAPALMRYGLSLAIGTAVAFFVSVGPAHWTVSVCDSLAINSAVPVVVAGLTLAATALWSKDASTRLRCELVASCASIAIALAVMSEPQCLGGPFAMIDPAAKAIWLAQVREMVPLTNLLHDTPVLGAWVSAFPAAALIAALLLTRTSLRFDFGFLVATLSLVVAVGLTVTVVKSYSYAMWFGMPLVAAGAVTLFTALKLSKPLRFLMACVLTPVAISASAITIAQAAVSPSAAMPLERQACFKTESYGTLAKLPAGLIATDVDFGPLMLAFTQHSVLAAPYHRLSHGIIAAHQVLSLPPDAARKAMTEAHVTYVVLCGIAKPSGLDDAALKTGLWSKLQSGAIPKWLELVPQTKGQQFLAYRIKRK